jgi:hypothetical protein
MESGTKKKRNLEDVYSLVQNSTGGLHRRKQSYQSAEENVVEDSIVVILVRSSLMGRKNFVHSLYKNAGWGWDYAWIELNNLTKRDIQWWRMIVLMSLKDPFVFAAKISHMRVIKSADISLYTDASTSVGGGAWLSSTDDQVLQEGFFRWSPEEIASIKRSGLDSKNFLMNEGTKVGINVLEFFAVFHFVIVWRQSLRGKVVKCNLTVITLRL